MIRPGLRARSLCARAVANSRLFGFVLWLVVFSLAIPGSGDEARPNRAPSAEAKKLLDELHDDMEGGIAIGLEAPIKRLLELGEGEQAVPVLVPYLHPGKNRGLRGQTAAECLAQLGPAAVAATPDLLKALKEPDDSNHEYVVTALIAISPPVEVMMPRLLELLDADKGNLRGDLAELLGNMGPAARAALPSLTVFVEDKTAKNREKAIKALAQIGWPRTHDVFGRLLHNHDDYKGRSAAAEVLRELGPAAAAAAKDLAAEVSDPAIGGMVCGVLTEIGPEAQEAIPSLIRALEHSKAFNAAEALGAIGPAAEAAIPPLIRLVGGTDDLDSDHAVNALSNIGHPTDAVIAALKGALTNKDYPVRRDAMTALAHLRGTAPEVVTAIEGHLSDSQSQVRCAAATALAELGEAARPALPALRKAVRSEDGQLRLSAAEALWRIDGQADLAAAVLVQALDSKDAGMQWSAADALRRIKSPRDEVISALVRMLSDKADNTRAEAAETLAVLGPKARAALPALRKELTDDVLRPRLESATALWRIAGDAASVRPVLAELVMHPDEESYYIVVRRQAASLLTEMAASDGQSAALLQQAAASADPAVRSIAAKALAKMK